MELLIKNFISGSSEFSLIYATGNKTLKHASNLFVLDSSFNPPHLGHLNLIQRCIDHYKKATPKYSLMLQLSVNNADKAPQPASFPNRLDMMVQFAKDIESRCKCDCFVVLTKHGRFVDKTNAIESFFDTKLKIVYLLGFDTLIRVFDAKYYLPLSVSAALQEFMDKTEIYCLTRDNEHDQQMKWLHESKEIPKTWIPKITLEVNNDTQTNSISSSQIRTILRENEAPEKLLTLNVLNYIKSFNPERLF